MSELRLLGTGAHSVNVSRARSIDATGRVTERRFQHGGAESWGITVARDGRGVLVTT